MFDKLRAVLGKLDVDYADIRYEIKKATVISFDGKELTQIGSNSTDGYVLRALKDGGFSSVVFTKESDAEKAAFAAAENARLIAQNIEKPVSLTKAEVVKDTSLPPLKEDPREVSMAEKLELIRKYNDIPLGYEKIATTTISYQEVIREKYFTSTEGTEIREDLVTTRLSGEIISKDGDLTQNVGQGRGERGLLDHPKPGEEFRGADKNSA